MSASVVQVTLWKGPYLGTFMASQLRLAGEVRRRLGLETHMVLAEGARGQPWLADLEAAGVTWSLLRPGRRAVRADLRAIARAHDAAVVHSHFTGADLEAAGAARAVGAPWVWHVHTGFEGYPLRQRAKDLVKVRAVARRQAAATVAVAPWVGALLRRRGMPGDRIVVLPNAIATERFDALPGRAEARTALGLPADARIALAFGWWPEAKGIDVLLDALEGLAPRRPGTLGLLVGEQALRDLVAARFPAPPPWLRLSGFVADPSPLFAAADVFVSASRHEGQPYAVGEALACGLPVVQSDIPGTAVYRAAPGVTTFPSGDAAALAERLATVDGDPATAAAARAWVRRELGVGAWAARLCALYAELLCSRPAPLRPSAERSSRTSPARSSPSATSASR